MTPPNDHIHRYVPQSNGLWQCNCGYWAYPRVAQHVNSLDRPVSDAELEEFQDQADAGELPKETT